jgi:hypothetical protein
MNMQLLATVRQYHKAVHTAWNAPHDAKDSAWDVVRVLGDRIRREYGIPTYCRIADNALRAV